jgi:hypothetical protein
MVKRPFISFSGYLIHLNHDKIYILASDLQRCFVDRNKRIKYITEERDKLNNLAIEADLQLLGVETYNFVTFGRPGSGKSAFITTNFSVLYEEYIMIAAISNSQVSFTQNISRFPLNKNQTFIGKDVFGFSEDNFKDVLDQLLAGQLVDRYKQGEPRKGPNVVNNPSINDMIHVVVMVMDSTNLDKKMIMSEYIEYIKLFQAQGIYLFFIFILFYYLLKRLCSSGNFDENR